MPDRRTLTRWARRSIEVPPHVAARKAFGLVRSTAAVREARRRDTSRSTFAAAPGALATYWHPIGIDDLRREARPLATAAASHLEHTFDLLGSGPVRVRHGMACPGLEGIRFPVGPPVDPRPDGRWLSGRINAANVRQAKATWSLVDADYRPIDWQLDFRSGFRWSESAWYRDIEFMGVRGRDVKVPWELGRMQHLPQLALAGGLARAREPGFAAPERYEREFRNQVLDFIATNPPRFGVNWVIAMDPAIRVANWLIARDLFIAGGSTFDPEFESVLAGSVLDHARFVSSNLEWMEQLHGNHYMADVAGLLFAAAYLPRSTETDAWLAFAARELLLEVDHQFWPDGANFEASTCYHRLVAEMVAWSVGLLLRLPADRLAALSQHPAAQFGTARPLSAEPIDTEIPAWLPDRIWRMAGFIRDATKPSGHVAQIGDNDSGRFLKLSPDRDSLRHAGTASALEALFGVPPDDLDGAVMRSLVGEGGLAAPITSRPGPVEVRVGDAAVLGTLEDAFGDAPPDRRRRLSIDVDGGRLDVGLEALAYPDFGFWLLRSPRLWLAVRCGPIGQQGNGGHAHNDQLSVELSVDGHDWLRDPGTYLYTPLPERRNAYRSSAAHTGPRFADGEPARLDIDLFTLGPEARATCLYWGPEGFAGVLRASRGRSAYCRVTVRGATIEIVHWTEGADLHGPYGDVLDWRVLAPTVPFSPGYGLVENEG